MAALLTRTSIPPSSSSARWAIRVTLLSSVTSAGTNSAFEPLFRLTISTASVSPSGSRMSAMITLAPSAAKAFAYTAPIPLAPPVTMTCFPKNLICLLTVVREPAQRSSDSPWQLPFSLGVDNSSDQVEQDRAHHEDHHPRRYVCRGGAGQGNEGGHDAADGESYVPVQSRAAGPDVRREALVEEHEHRSVRRVAEEGQDKSSQVDRHDRICRQASQLEVGEGDDDQV